MARTVDRSELEALRARGAQLVEVLSSRQYEESHLPGAVHIPLRGLDATSVQALDRTKPVVVYCWDSA